MLFYVLGKNAPMRHIPTRRRWTERREGGTNMFKLNSGVRNLMYKILWICTKIMYKSMYKSMYNSMYKSMYNLMYKILWICTNPYTKKTSYVQNCVQNLCSNAHFFMVYVQIDVQIKWGTTSGLLVPLLCRDPQNCPISDNFAAPGSHWLNYHCVDSTWDLDSTVLGACW